MVSKSGTGSTVVVSEKEKKKFHKDDNFKFSFPPLKKVYMWEI